LIRKPASGDIVIERESMTIHFLLLTCLLLIVLFSPMPCVVTLNGPPTVRRLGSENGRER